MKENRGTLSFLIISIFFFTGAILVWHFFIDDTIRLSKGSGFYEEEFDLRIRTKPSLTIRYTLDGSSPDEESLLYEGPLHISDPSSSPNVYSARTDTSGFFVTEFSKSDIYKAPDQPVDKCVALRAAAFDRTGKKVREISATYFVGMAEKQGYDGLYTVSLITDPDNLFDKSRGIYVLGDLFDDYVKETGELTDYVRNWEANYNEEGREWEREAHFTIFDTDGNIVCDSDSGVRIQGKGSRKNNQKSLGFYAREEYGGSNKFGTRLFDRIEGTHKIKLNCGGQDEFVKLRDWLIQELISESDLKIGTLKMIPTTLFVDGEYWGVYYIQEAINDDYVESHYGLDADNSIIINAEELTHGNEGDKEAYYDIVYDFARQYGADDPGLYQHICDYYIDIDSFTDFYAVEIYISNADWPLKNSACWRARETSGNAGMDGKWRYIIYDTNMEGCMKMKNEPMVAKAVNDDALFAALMENEEYRKKFCDKIEELENGIFSWENVEKHIVQWRSLMEEPLVKSSIRFSGSADQADIDLRIETMKSFFENRGDIVRAEIKELYGE